MSSGSPRTSAIRRAWISALSFEMCGSTPDAVVCTASGGTSPFGRPGLYGRSSLRYAARFSSNMAFRSFEFGPRLLKKVAAGL